MSLLLWEAEHRRKKVPPAASVMLKQEDLALLRAVTMIQGNPVLLRELRKALAAKKTRPLLAARSKRLELE
jgi:hypothetical protein